MAIFSDWNQWNTGYYRGYSNPYLKIKAANLKSPLCVQGERYTIENFKNDYPQFFSKDTNPPTCELVPDSILNVIEDIVNNIVDKCRWGSWWYLGCGYAMAHLVQMFINGTQQPGSSKQALMANSLTGYVTSKQVDDLSITYDLSFITDKLKDYGLWTLTTYGIQWASLARLFYKGNMYVW